MPKKMQKQPQERLSFAERNEAKVKKLLDRDAGAVRAVMANTVETRTIASKLAILDMIFDNARQSVGYKLEYKQFEEIVSMFKKASEELDKVIELAEKYEIFIPRDKRVSEFQKNKEAIVRLLSENKAEEEIAKELNLDLQRVLGWVGTIKRESEQKEQDSSAAEKTTVAKKETAKKAA